MSETVIKYRWDEFTEYCEDVGISLEHRDDWGAGPGPLTYDKLETG